MTDDEKRKKSIEELQKLMQEQRARLDPAVLKRAQNAALESQKKANATTAAQKPAASQDEPYDRENAAKAIEIFLKGHGNSREFQMKLLENLKKKDH